ncbi:S1 family peptidase [Arthrobacter sp. AK04]|uniref:S1 family peptidase n=1 Tax=Arthrobacter sp. AK04 TaxID=2900048 RepID=UPI001E2975AC|nr:S1 family peptidase [Arthrobacter sp. AK04]MCD5340796.1 S1 family peptidase [Arthrobacter sp. AK04]
MSGQALRRVLSLGAAAGILATSAVAAAPGWAVVPPAEEVVTGGGPGSSSLSDAALADAVQRDLGLTPEQFAAAGEIGSRAAAAAGQLRTVPGYAGTRLQDGRIVVSGAGPELQDAVAVLAAGIPGLVLEAPASAVVPAAPNPASPNRVSPNLGSELALSTEQLFQAYVAEVGLQGLQAVVTSGGKFVIRTGAVSALESAPDGADAKAAVAGNSGSVGTGRKSAAEFVARFANVELDDGTPLAPEEDVRGGVGYIADTGNIADPGWICSTGFSAFDPAGLPAVLTAGHCASDGAAETAELEFQFNRTGPLGKFGYSQFGGPGNSPVLRPGSVDDPLQPGDPGNVGTDIAVVESLRADLDPLPAASTWGDVSQPEPEVKIIGTAEPVAGMPVCRSGRTSAWSCGTVDAVGIFVVPGPGYAADPNDLRAFNGFLSYGVQSSGGDSGGPYLSGNYAVGTHAAGDTPDEQGNVVENFAVGATLADSLAVLPGYQLELFLNRPAVSSPAPGATYEPGQAISGTVPAAPATAVAAGSNVRITMQGKEFFDVPVNADGTWSFPAPEGKDALRFTAETVNGFSASGAADFEFAPAAPARPAPTEPAPPAQPAPEEPPASPGPVPADPAPADPAPSPTESSPADQDAVVVPAPAATPPADPAGGYARDRNSGGLAYAGASALPAAGAAAGAIAVGTLLVALVRRRRQHTSD